MSFRNRCVIATANGVLSLSIPILGGRTLRSPFRDVRIDPDSRWQEKHWRSILSAYGNAPMFFHYADSLEALYQKPSVFLLDWNLSCMDWVNRQLGLSIHMNSGMPADEGEVLDLRDRIRPSNFQDPAMGPFPVYPQVFADKIGFQPNLSILDFVLCMGKQALPLISQ